MRTNFINAVIEAGVREDFSPSERRSVVFANCISLILSTASILLFVLIRGNQNMDGFMDTVKTVAIFSVPIILNRYSLINLSKIYLCWVPPLSISWLMLSGMHLADKVSIGTYDGLRLYLVAASCIPYILLNRKDLMLFIVGILPTLVLILFFREVVDLAGADYLQKGVQEWEIGLTQTRYLVAYVIINGSCFSLKFIIDKSDQLNQHLIGELEQKNEIIQAQAKNDVMELNVQLRDNLQKLIKYNRELTLLSTINDTTSKATDTLALLRELCPILINQGGYKLAWVGEKPSPTENKRLVKSVTSYGSPTDYVDELNVDLDDEDQKKGPTAKTLLTGKTSVINCIMTAPGYEVWRERASKFGFRSSVAICIDARPVTTYALNIYSDLDDSFDEKEVNVLERVVKNVSNAIKAIHASNERDKAKHELQGAYERLNYHVNNTPLAVIERDKDLKVTFWNKRAEELFGWEQKEVLGKETTTFLVLEEDHDSVKSILQEITEGGFQANVREIRNVSKDGKILFCNWYYSMLRDENGSMQGLLSFVSDVTEQKATNYQLKQRIKELTTLYRSGQILQNKDRVVDEVLQELVTIIPQGSQFPERTAARIVVGGIDFKTKNYSEGTNKQRAEFQLPQGFKGVIELVYLESTPTETEGVFFAEERDFINMIAEMLRTFFVRRYESDALRKSEANLNATINNTNVIIWSVDRNMNLLAGNRPFFKHMKERYELEPVIGNRILKDAEGDSFNVLGGMWENLCKQALEGEIVTFEENKFGVDFHCSLCPIIEDDGSITGVSIFAEDITNDKLRAKELGEALQKIGELRLMALRSVMNPHFVFNVLNSIQFYIVGNDRLNAVNYLSTFSKLIRSILTHSVNNKIKLEDEIEMLKNYVQLEMVRFENKFSFHLEVDPQLETDSIEIPSLLIQPYVENAILHGLYNKEGKGQLTIRIRDQGESIFFEIEDDGVGREAAMKIKQRSFGEHKSMGVKLTEERLKLINEHHNVSYEVIDLMKEGQPSGTKVVVWVKVY